MSRWIVKVGAAYWTGPHMIMHDTSPRRARAWVFANIESARMVAGRLPAGARVFRIVSRKGQS